MEKQANKFIKIHLKRPCWSCAQFLIIHFTIPPHAVKKKEKKKKGSSLEAKFQLIPNSFFLEQYELAASDEVIPPISLSLVFADQIDLISFLWELLQLWYVFFFILSPF